MTTTDIVEPAFERLLQGADGLAELLLDLDPTFPGPVQHDDYPSVTLGWLRTGMTKQYRGMLILLGNRDLAIESEILLRSLIEGFARVAWIVDGVGEPADDPRDARCRAVCLEFGIALQRQREITGKKGFILDDDQRMTYSEMAAARLADATARHSEIGCGCAGPSFQVEPVLRATAGDREGVLIHDQWIMGSGAAHNFLPTRYYAENSDGTTQVGGSIKYGLRAYLLRVSLIVLCRPGQRMLAVHGASQNEIDRLSLWVAAYSETPPLRNALRNELD